MRVLLVVELSYEGEGITAEKAEYIVPEINATNAFVIKQQSEGPLEVNNGETFGLEYVMEGDTEAETVIKVLHKLNREVVAISNRVYYLEPVKSMEDLGTILRIVPREEVLQQQERGGG